MSDGSLRGKTEWLRRRVSKLEELPCSCGELQRLRGNNTLRPLALSAVASDPVGDYKTVGRFLGRKEGTELFVSPPQETGSENGPPSRTRHRALGRGSFTGGLLGR